MNIRTTTSAVSLLATSLAVTLLPHTASADVELLHDKGFWSEQLQVVGDAADKATGNRIIETAYANPEQYKAFVQTSVAGGDMPDMFTWWTGGVFEDLVSTGKMIERGDFDAGLRDFYSVGDHAYGVPLHLSRWVALYNTEHFNKAGLEEPKSWEELLAAAEALKAADIVPFHATTQDGWRGFIWTRKS